MADAATNDRTLRQANGPEKDRGERWIPSPSLPPPTLETGVGGWLKRNLFSSPGNALLTFAGLALLAWAVPPAVKWAFIDANWFGDSRQACDTGRPGACWVFIKVRLDLFIYGFYPEAERWRVDFIFLALAASLPPLLVPEFFRRASRQTALGLAAAGAAFFLFGAGPAGIFLAFFLFPFVPALWRRQKTGRLSVTPWRWASLMLLLPMLAWLFLYGGHFGLPLVETHYWGGLFLSLVVACSGMITALPIGILLALGRRSEMPVVRTVCVTFIEFVWGVPLVSVLFMASVMLPLFLPEDVNFDKLLRALVGVALFYAAYMAEAVRGGLQAVPKGQYEAARALGWGYWKMTSLIILPQALRLIIPGLANNFLSLLKDTTLVAVIGLLDLLGIAKAAMADAQWLGFTRESYVFAGAVFWILCFGLSRYCVHLERKLHIRHH